MVAEEGVTEAEGGVPKPKAGNMEGEERVTKAEGGVTEAEAGNMEAKEGVIEADGGVVEADLEEATEVEGGVTEPHLEEAADCEGGVTEAKEVAQEMECGDHETLSNMLAVGDVFAVKADDEEMEYWLLRCTARKHKITKKEIRCPWNTEHIFMRDEMVVFGRYFVFQKKLKGLKFIYVEAKKTTSTSSENQNGFNAFYG
ncbi:hypothetical protein R1flu_008006 [Riccia fluitans]|uniref:Uncharacterized protein n=1 Tax=Riccia fluitans TaxID=41844 RepID=A0ABD1YAT6_9MARC